MNLKRFDVPRSMGGVCTQNNAADWIRDIIRKSVQLGIGSMQGMQVTYLLPEALIIPAAEELSGTVDIHRGTLQIGCQSVFREDVKQGGNFGAFTTNLPAAAAKNMGCDWTIIGHSEERRDKQGIIGAFMPEWNSEEETRKHVVTAVSGLLCEQVVCALKQGINVLFCIGETADERGEGGFEEQKNRIENVLRGQIKRGLKGINEHQGDRSIVIGYEPVWAIGPGKTPPDSEYITFVSGLIKEICVELFERELPVVYGGGLKSENAKAIAKIKTIDGGLVALTRFSGDIGFYIDEFKDILDEYIAGGSI